MVYPQPLLDQLAGDPDGVALESGGRRTSRAELLGRIGAYQASLRAAGVEPGDGVAIATAVTVDGLAAQLAAHSLGARVVGIRPGLPRWQLGHLLSEIRVLLAEDGARSTELIDAHGRRPVLRVDPELPSSSCDLVVTGRPDDVALVTFTSGSTGAPKGVATDYRAMSQHWAHAPQCWSDRTRALAAGYGRFALFGSLSSAVMQEHLSLCLLSGGTAVIPAGVPVFPDLFEQLQISACLLTVPRLHAVLDALAVEPVDLSSLRSVIVAGSPLSPRRLRQMVEVFGPAARQGYGQTETGMLTLLLAEELGSFPEAVNSVGRPMPGVDVEERNGELWVRSASQMCGYWHNPAETEAVLQDGWIRTRDLGRVDQDGFVHLTGRVRDVVIVNAIVHYAGPIEHALQQSPAVDQAYLVGVPDEQTGEAAHAFIVPMPGARPDHADLRRLVAAELGEAAVPRTIVEIDQVPIGPSGKPDKKALAERLIDSSAGPAASTSG